MLQAEYNWKLLDDFSEEQIASLAKKLSISKLLAKLLLERGINDEQTAKAFLDPQADQLGNPFALHDMKKAVGRIKKAIEDQEKIIVYGDYDVDGITSTAVMYEALEQLGAQVEYFVPDRIRDGYGPNPKRYQALILAGAKLIITVDNGVAGFAAIELAQKNGVDVIVTDHHAIGKKLPPAYAIIHPDFPGSVYSCQNLAGVGVAFKTACALLENVPQEMLDLVALGTIADLVKLTGENRLLVKFGLQVLQQTQRIGLQVLAQKAGIVLENADEQTVAFGFAPRLNSLGRLDQASAGVELLTTFDEISAGQIAAKIEELNQKRQKLAEEYANEALQQIQPDQLVNVVASADWQVGLLGIVASRLVEKTHRPSLVFNLDEKSHSAKGSGRSVSAFDLFKALDPQRSLMTAFGGHEQACGLTLPSDNLLRLQVVLNEAARQQQIMKAPKEKLVIAARLDLKEATTDLIKELDLLKPFGNGNPEPVFLFKNYQIKKAKMVGKQQNHLHFILAADQKVVNAIDFFAGPQAASLIADPAAFEVAGHVTLNRWKNQEKPQIMVADLAVKRPVISDQRSLQHNADQFALPGQYFFFQEKHFLHQKKKIPSQSKVIVGQQKIVTNQKIKRLILADCPDSFAQLKELLQKLKTERLDLLFLPSIDLRHPLPTRAELAKVYRFVATHQQIDLKKDLIKLAAYLKISQGTLIFILEMFFDAGFVKIRAGLMTGNLSHKKVDLTKTASYRARIKKLKTQKILLESSFTDLKKWIIQFLID